MIDCLIDHQQRDHKWEHSFTQFTQRSAPNQVPWALMQFSLTGCDLCHLLNLKFKFLKVKIFNLKILFLLTGCDLCHPGLRLRHLRVPGHPLLWEPLQVLHSRPCYVFCILGDQLGAPMIMKLWKITTKPQTAKSPPSTRSSSPFRTTAGAPSNAMQWYWNWKQ